MNKTNLLLVIIILSAAFFCAATGVASAFTLSDKYVGNTVVDLEWSEYGSPDFSKYELCRDDDLIHTESNRSNTFYRDEGLSKGNKYNYEIKVYNASGGLVDTSTKKTVTAGEVHGTITRDTTWTAASSPYTLSNRVYVAEDTTLTISPGVTVKNDDKGGGVLVYGTLSSENVTFDAVGIAGKRGSRYLSVRDCLFNYGSIGFYGNDSSAIGNTFTNNDESIAYVSGNNNILKDNILINTTDKYGIGIWLEECNHAIVAGNTLPGVGIKLYQVYNSTIMGNIVSNASHHGIRMDHASYNTIAGNIITNSTHYGIVGPFGVSENNIIRDNIVSNNLCGIILRGDYNNTIYNNYFDNGECNAYSKSEYNIWNITKTPGTNIVGGPYLGGNYWSDYTGTDADDDGFGDTPYEIYGDTPYGTVAKDYLPLVKFSSPVWNVDTGEWFEKIQEAIGDPDTQDGHTIRVYEGTYTENVKVNKSLTIRSRGGREVTIVQANDSDDHVFEVMKDSTTIQGFTINGATGEGKAGIYIHGSTVSDCKVANNTAESNHYGVYLDGAVECNGIENNRITHNSEHGIFLKECKHITISNNTLENNYANGHGMYLLESTYNQILNNEIHVSKYDGINLNNSDDNEITNNTVLSNWENGIVLFNSSRNDILENIVNSNYNCGIVLNSASGNNITNNTAKENKESGFSIIRESKDNIFVNNTALKNYQHGIEIHRSNNNTLASNNANSNTWVGISLCYLSDNTLTSNNVSSNPRGIWLYHSSDNTLADNNVNSNYAYGIFLEFSSKNTILNNTVTLNGNRGIFLAVSSNNNIHNNHFNNTNNAYVDGNNVWNIAKATGTNIVGGPYLGGNYWSDYKGEDKDGDYLGDTLLPYNATGSIQTGGDEHPLIIPIDLSIESKDIVAPDKVDVDTVPAYGEVQIVEIEATVHNNGIYDVHNVEVQLNIKFRDKTTLTLSQKKTIDKIAAGSSANVTFEWGVLEWVKDNLEDLWAEDQGGILKAPVDVEQRANFVYVEVVVDPENKIRESDETNNAALAESEKTLLRVIPDVEITFIRPIQVVEEVPLIKDKPMMTRVWVKLWDGELFAEAHNVKVKVDFDDGNPAQELEMCLINHKGEGEKYVTYVVPEGRVDEFKHVLEKGGDEITKSLFETGREAFNFEYDRKTRNPFPRSVGNLNITASLQNIDADENNNQPDKTVTVKAAKMNSYTMLFRPVDSWYTSHVFGKKEHEELMNRESAFIKATYPVPTVIASYVYYEDPKTISMFRGLGGAIYHVAAMTLLLDSSISAWRHGLDSIVWIVPNGALGTGTYGMALKYLPTRAVFVDEITGIRINKFYGLHLSAHEIGHTWKLANGNWAEGYDGDHRALYVAGNGWDVEHKVSSWMGKTEERPRDLKPPKYSYYPKTVEATCNYHTFMGSPRVDRPWITTNDYKILMKGMVKGGSDPRLLLVSGKIYENDSVDFQPFYPGEGIPDAIPPGDYTFECIAENGTVLSNTSFEPYFDTYGTDEGEVIIAFFFFTIPYPDDTTKIVLEHNDSVLKEVVKTPNAPIIIIDSVNDLGGGNYEVTWNATDADGDNLTYMLSYSHNNGEIWLPLEDKLNETVSSYTFNPHARGLGGGNSCLIKIVAIDRINDAEATSDPFSVPTNPPDVSISSPADGSTFNQGDEIEFDSFGYDSEDGVLNGSTFVWTTSIDVEIARGVDYFTLSNLSQGEHQITLTVTDSEGKTANASVNITIVKIVINEVYPYPGAVQDAKEEWIEVYNAGELEVNLTGWRIVDGDSDLNYTIPANDSAWDGILESGSYLVFHIGGTLDTPAEDIYGNFTSGVLNDTNESISLLSANSTGKDIVRYGNCTDEPPAGTFWTGVNPDAPVQGQSLGRDKDSTDTNDGNDWENTGGIDVDGPTAGLRNFREVQPPNITSYAPESPVQDTVCNWRTFNITVNQTVNVSWYLNDSLQFKNESVTEANYTLHAEVAGEHNVSAVTTNPNGTDMQMWIWNVTVAPAPAPPNITSFASPSPVNDVEGATRIFNIKIDQPVNISWQINGTEVQTNTSVTEASYTNTSAAIGTWNVSAIATNANGTDMQTWIWTVEASSPCYIATATYGTPLDENIDVLRDFRDEVLMTNPVGEAFVSTYYATSPPIADALRENEGLRTITRLTLITPLVYLSKFALNGILVVFIVGLTVVPLYLRRDRKKILKSLLVGMGSILVLIAAIFSLGFAGYAIPFCAVVGAYMLPFVIPLSVVFTLCTVLKLHMNVSHNIKTLI